jgi:hypothetical protein
VNARRQRFRPLNAVLPASVLGVVLGYAILLAVEPELSGLFIFHVLDPALWRHLGSGAGIFVMCGVACVVGAYLTAGMARNSSTRICAAVAAAVIGLLLYLSMTITVVLSAVS